MRRGILFLSLSLLLHAPLAWWTRAPARGSMEPPLVVWQAPPVAGARAAKGHGPARSAGVGSAAPSAATAEWWTMGDLAAEGNRPPAYPEEALEREWEGTVGLKIEFSEGGDAKGVSVERSSGFPVLDRAALEAARGWKLRGAERPRQVRIPIRFELSEES